MKRWRCPCEGCKHRREERAAARRLKSRQAIEARALELSRAIMSSDKFRRAERIGRHVLATCQRHLNDTWHTHDGRDLPVQAMALSHLFFALAKHYRGEYPHGSLARRGVEGLQAEALRRLTGVHFPQSFYTADPATGRYHPLEPEPAIDWSAEDALVWRK